MLNQFDMVDHAVLIKQLGCSFGIAGNVLCVAAVPDPPVSIIVRCNSVNRTAEIWWQPGKENYAPILNFIVQYNTSFQPDLWYNIATNVSQNSRRIVVTMSPWGNYTFRVMSRNKIGLSLPSFQSRNVCHTEPGVPDTNPENVIGEGDQPGNLVIFWTVGHTLTVVVFLLSVTKDVSQSQLLSDYPFKSNLAFDKQRNKMLTDVIIVAIL